MKRVDITNSERKPAHSYILTMCFVLILMRCSISHSQTLEEFVRQSHQQAGDLAQNESAAASIPGYSSSDADRKASEINSKSDIDLKSEANKRISDARVGKGESSDQILVEAMKKKPLDNIEDHAIFKKAEKIYENPVTNLENLTDEKCKELVNEQRNQYTKQTRTIKRRDIEYEEVTCEKPDETITCEKVLEVTCEAGGDCDSGGIVRGSVASDMQFTYNYPTLTIGTIADNYWGGHCAQYDKLTTFKIENLKDITEFRISQVGFDDYLWIKVNGTTVYVGPDGGDRLELTQKRWIFGTHTVVSNGHGTNGCERMTNWNFPVNIDLKPYIVEGENQIWTRVIVSGAGEGWMQITAKQFCCNKFKDTWTKKCRSN